MQSCRDCGTATMFSQSGSGTDVRSLSVLLIPSSVPQFKPLLTLLELREPQPARCRLQACGAEGTVRDGGIRDGKRGMARSRSPAAARRFRCWWRWPSWSPTWSASASSPASAFRSRTSPPASRSCCCGRRRHRRAVRGVLLRRTRRDVSALERRVQFPRPGLPPGLRVCGGLGVGDRRLRRTGRAGRDGVRRIRQVGRSQMRRRWRWRSAWSGWCRSCSSPASGTPRPSN